MLTALQIMKVCLFPHRGAALKHLVVSRKPRPYLET